MTMAIYVFDLTFRRGAYFLLFWGDRTEDECSNAKNVQVA